MILQTCALLSPVASYPWPWAAGSGQSCLWGYSSPGPWGFWIHAGAAWAQHTTPTVRPHLVLTPATAQLLGTHTQFMCFLNSGTEGIPLPAQARLPVETVLVRQLPVSHALGWGCTSALPALLTRCPRVSPLDEIPL